MTTLAARTKTQRQREKAVAANPVLAKRYWKHRRKLGRQRVRAHATQDARRGFGLGAGAAMATAGLQLTPGGFGETPKQWVRRNVLQRIGKHAPRVASRLPGRLKAWHLLAAPVVGGTLGGGAIGAFRGMRKGKNPWHSSREHTVAVRRAYGSRERKAPTHATIPKPRRLLQREEIIEAIIEATIWDRGGPLGGPVKNRGVVVKGDITDIKAEIRRRAAKKMSYGKLKRRIRGLTPADKKMLKASIRAFRRGR